MRWSNGVRWQASGAGAGSSLAGVKRKSESAEGSKENAHNNVPVSARNDGAAAASKRLKQSTINFGQFFTN